MKLFLTTFAILVTLMSCSSNRNIVPVPANDKIIIDNKYMDSFEATIRNKSFQNLEVAVINDKTMKQTSGFGLGKKATVEVIVGEGETLHILNPNQKEAKLNIDQRFMDSDKIMDPKSTNNYVSFTLVNNTAKSIPLIIPTVMNPNLSPFSKSGVDLKYGQKVYFKAKGKRHILLIVNDKIKDGDILKVGQLIKQRKQELDL